MASLVLTGDTSGQVTIAAPAVAGTTTLTLPATTGSVIGSNSSGNIQFNSGYGSVATAYGCRAWVNWTGGGTTINGSGNVTSITRNGTGSYTVNFTTAMPDANYSSSWAVSNAGAAPVGVVVGLTGPNLNSNNYSAANITTTSCRVLIGNMSASTPADPTGYCSATFFR